MQQSTQLNLLIIDDNQLFAEQLVGLLSNQYYEKVNLGFLDDKEELIKLLRQSWDVLVMGNAYDLTLPQVIDILKTHEMDLPVIAIIPEVESNIDKQSLTASQQKQLEMVTGDDKTDKLMPLFVAWGAVDALPKDRITEMAIRVHQEHQQLALRHELIKLRHILADAEQRANILITNSKSAVAYIEEGLHIYANAPYLEMFGFKTLDDLLGMPVVDLIASNNIKDFKQFLKNFEKGERDNVEFAFESIRNDGSTFAAKLQLAAATYAGEPCLQVIIQANDQANSAELAKKLAAAERIDPLTQLFNRRGFEQTLPTIREAVIQKQFNQVALIAVHIDNIGKINSMLGIQGVDNTLLTLSDILKQHTAQLLGEQSLTQGYISRFSDSYFALILPNVDSETVAKWSHEVLAQIKDTLIEVGPRTTKAVVSIGATMMTNNAPDVATLVNRAVQAANTARKQNQSEEEEGSYYLYDPSLFANSDEKALLEALRNALSQSTFQLLYQPIYDVETDVSNLFEVLLRLPLADGTLMSPDKFIDVANQHNLMDKIDRWVMIRACKDLKQYRTEVDPTARLLIRLSPVTISDDDLSAFVANLNKAVGNAQPGMLTLQFSEAVINDYLQVAKKQSTQLKAVGAHLGVYNFGSQIKSIEMLEYVQPDLVRLDRSYIKDLNNSENVNTITSLVSQINQYHCSSLMSFIEDPASMSAAWTVGVRYLQGSYLQAPSERMHIETDEQAKG